MIEAAQPVVLTLRAVTPQLLNNGVVSMPAPVVLALTPFYAGERGQPGEMTAQELAGAIDQGVAAQRFDFASLVDAAISI